ncbi:hypothetical protein EDD11_003959 [Mortierella claussenii]|nr:hypothetical protein EDD11_003959 [Mortierella claussenii]
MGFLIDILQTLQSEPCGCDLVQGCFCSPDGEVEDHSGMAPCYVCGEWYAEQVYCRDEETMEIYRVDGRRWHESQGTSLRHHVAENRVRAWLDLVVVAPSTPQATVFTVQAPLQRSSSMPAHLTASAASEPTASAMPRRSRTMTSTPTVAVPASFSIPQEILDPSRRSPGFRIKNRDVAVPTPNVAETESTSSTACSSRFSFTSERFRMAVQGQEEKLPAARSPVSVPVAVPTLITVGLVTSAAPVRVTSLLAQEVQMKKEEALHAADNKVEQQEDALDQSNVSSKTCCTGKIAMEEGIKSDMIFRVDHIDNSSNRFTNSSNNTIAQQQESKSAEGRVDQPSIIAVSITGVEAVALAILKDTPTEIEHNGTASPVDAQTSTLPTSGISSAIYRSGLASDLRPSTTVACGTIRQAAAHVAYSSTSQPTSVLTYGWRLVHMVVMALLARGDMLPRPCTTSRLVV